MMTDKLLRFSDSQALANNAPSENVIRVGKGDIGVGNNMSIYVHTAGAGGNAAFAVTLETGDEEDLSDAQSVVVFNVPNDRAVAGGKVVDARIPTGCKTFLRLKYGGLTSGTVSAGLVKDA
jgi:hypothetical protein